jgi:hypothetical protein
MTSANVEGTVVLNGLIEGPLPDDPAVRDRLRTWVRDVARLGLEFQLETAGGSFSLLPDNQPRAVQPLGDSPHEAIRQMVEQLLEPWPRDAAGRVTSTLRSSEFRRGEEVQSVYLIGPGGSVRVEQRTVAADTQTPPRPPSPRELVRMLLVGIVLAAALFGVTSLFVDVPALARQLIGTMRPVQADEVEIDDSAYRAYFRAGIERVTSDALTLKLQRTPQFPTTDAELQQAADAAEGSIKQWLAVAALARGHVQCDLYDDNEKYVGTGTVRISNLRESKALTVQVPLRTTSRFRLGKIVFTL